MTKFQLLAAAAAAAFATACAGTQSAQTETQNLTASTSSTSARTAPSTPVQTATPSTQAQTTAQEQQAQATPTPAAPATPTTFTDDQLRSFARAAIEIDPISRTLANATPEQTATATEQIRGVLARNNIDSATYNAIASRAQADPAFASRIAALNRTDPNAG